MLVLLRRLVSRRIFPFSWSLFTIVLLCMPGTMVPGVGLLGIKHLDKLAHLIVFGLNVLFWGLYYRERRSGPEILIPIFRTITGITMAAGVLMEFVQLWFVPYRYFDSGDVLADMLGAAMAHAWLGYQVRKIGV